MTGLLRLLSRSRGQRRRPRWRPWRSSYSRPAESRGYPCGSMPSSGPVLPAPALLTALGGRSARGERVGRGGDRVRGRSGFCWGRRSTPSKGSSGPLAGAASLRRDTLLLPIQFVSEVLPRSTGRPFPLRCPCGAAWSTMPPRAVTAKGRPADPNRLAQRASQGTRGDDRRRARRRRSGESRPVLPRRAQGETRHPAARRCCCGTSCKRAGREGGDDPAAGIP